MSQVGLLKHTVYIFCSIECLDYTYARYRLFEMGDNPGHKRLCLDSPPLERTAYAAYDNGRKRKGQKSYQSKLGRHVEKPAEKADYKQRFPEKHMKTVCHAVLHLSDIVRY